MWRRTVTDNSCAAAFPSLPQCSTFAPVSKVLITGIGSGQGQLVARKLLRRQQGYQVIGVDRTPWDDRPRGVGMVLADVRKRKFEDVIRRERPEVIVHLASVRHFKSHPALRH